MSGPARTLTREYSIHAVLGSGGFGKVYLARDRLAGDLERYAALKVLRLDAPLSYQERFRDEAAILTLLDHPSFVKVHALFQLDGRWCIDMEYVRGLTLARLTERLRKIPVGPALEMTLQVARALDLAWSYPGPTGEPLRVLHRDIKPSNLILTRAGVVKVLDFGIARWQSAPRRATPTESRLPASAGYMAPERYGFKADFGAEADVYALGVVLWEMLVGEPYLRPGSPLVELTAEPATFMPHAEGQRARLSAVAGPEVIALVQQMLAWKPESRPTAAEVAQRCQALLSAGGLGASWLPWLETEVLPLIARQQLGEEPDGWCGRVLRSDPLPMPDPARPGHNTFLPLTGLPSGANFDTRPPSDLGGSSSGPPPRTSLGERLRGSLVWVVLGAFLLFVTALASGWLADADGDGARASADCDDQDATMGPGEPERCDGKDNDCDGQIDEGLPEILLYADADGDGYGVGEGLPGCRAEAPGRASRAGDCDDQDADRTPDKREILVNQVDDDCDPGTPDVPKPALTSAEAAPRPTGAAARPNPTESAAPPEPAPVVRTGAVKLLGARVSGVLYDASGAMVTRLASGSSAAVPPGTYKAVVESPLMSGVELGPFRLAADDSVLLDCSTPLMGQLCTIK